MRICIGAIGPNQRQIGETTKTTVTITSTCSSTRTYLFSKIALSGAEALLPSPALEMVEVAEALQLRLLVAQSADRLRSGLRQSRRAALVASEGGV